LLLLADILACIFDLRVRACDQTSLPSSFV
jgi:hypothetical protein